MKWSFYELRLTGKADLGIAVRGRETLVDEIERARISVPGREAVRVASAGALGERPPR